MGKTVYKYTLNPGRRQDIAMPEGAELLHVAFQGPDLCVWASVDTARPLCKRRLLAAMTGDWIEEPVLHVGTALNDDQTFVLHVFELVEVRDDG